MRRLILVTLFLTGCVGVVGPRQRAAMTDPVDDRNLTIEEQMRKSRDRLAYPDQIPTVEAPRTALDPPDQNRNGR